MRSFEQFKAETFMTHKVYVLLCAMIKLNALKSSKKKAGICIVQNCSILFFFLKKTVLYKQIEEKEISNVQNYLKVYNFIKFVLYWIILEIVLFK